MAIAAGTLTLAQFEQQFGSEKPYYEFWAGTAIQKTGGSWALGLAKGILVRFLNQLGLLSALEVTAKIDPTWLLIPDVIATNKRVIPRRCYGRSTPYTLSGQFHPYTLSTRTRARSESGTESGKNWTNTLRLNRVCWSIAALSLFSLALTADSPSEKTRVRWSPLLKLDNRKAIEARLTRPFGDVFQGTSQGSKETVANCNDYLLLSSKGFRSDTPADAGVLHNDAVECVALDMLRNARAPQASSFPVFQMNTAALTLLPPQLAPAVSTDSIAKAKAADAAGQSWKTYVPQAVAVTLKPGQIAVSQPGWKTQLTLYARGDFSGSGNEEILVRADYTAVGGTYQNSELFLLASGDKGAKRLRLIRQVSVP